MKHLHLLFITIFLFTTVAVKAQTPAKTAIPIYTTFDQLSPMLHPSANNDTVYLFNFWATYCGPCVQELPHFERVTKELTGEKVKVVLVSVDFKSEIESRVIPFIQKRKIQSKVVLLSDPNANMWIDKVSEQWGGALPATLAVKGNARQFYGKALTYDELKKITTNLLSK